MDAIIHIFALPVQWLATLLALPDSLAYWNFYLANLFFLTALGLAWWSFYVWHRSRHHFYLALYIFIIALGVVGYFATTLYAYAWIYALVGIVAGLQTIWRLSRSAPAPERIRRLLHHFVVLGVIISIGLPVVYSLHHEWVTSRLSNDLSAQLNDHAVTLDQLVRAARDDAAAFAADPVIVKELADGRDTEMTVDLQSRMLEKGLQFVTVTDALGTVVARASQPTATADNLFEELPWLAPVYNKESVNGAAFNERGAPILAAAEPVMKEDIVQGVVLVGYSLNDQFAITEGGRAHHGLVIGTDQGVVGISATTAREHQVLSSAAFNDTVRTATRGNTAFSRSFQLDSARFLAQSRLVGTLVPGKSIALVAVREDQSTAWLIAVDTAVIVLGGILVLSSLVTSRSLLDRIRRRKPVDA